MSGHRHRFRSVGTTGPAEDYRLCSCGVTCVYDKRTGKPKPLNPPKKEGP